MHEKNKKGFVRLQWGLGDYTNGSITIYVRDFPHPTPYHPLVPTPSPFTNLSVSFIAPVSDTGWAGVTPLAYARPWLVAHALFG